MQAIIIFDTNNNLSKEQVVETGKALTESFGEEFTIVAVPEENFAKTKLSDFAPLTVDQALAAICISLGGQVRQNRSNLIKMLFNASQNPTAYKKELELLRIICKNSPSHNAKLQYGYTSSDRDIIAMTLNYSNLL